MSIISSLVDGLPRIKESSEGKLCARELRALLRNNTDPDQEVKSALQRLVGEGRSQNEIFEIFTATLDSLLAEKEADTKTLRIMRSIIIQFVLQENHQTAYCILQKYESKHTSLARNEEFVVLKNYVSICAGKFAEAKQQLGVHLRIHPHHIGLLLLDAVVSISTRDAPRAIERYHTILLHYKNPPREVFVGLALTHYLLDNLTESVHSLNRALQDEAILQDQLKVLEFEFLIIFIRIIGANSDCTVSFDSFMQQIARTPENLWAKSYLIVWFMCEAMLNTLPSEEAFSFSQSLKNRLRDSDSYSKAYVDYTLARSLQKLGKHRDALEAYKRSFRANSVGNPVHPSLIGFLQAAVLLPEDLTNLDLEATVESCGNLQAKKHLAEYLLEKKEDKASHYISKLTKAEGLEDPECWVLRSLGDRMNPVHSSKCLSRAAQLLTNDNSVTSKIKLIVLFNEQAFSMAQCNQIDLEFPAREAVGSDRCFSELLHSVFLHNSGVQLYNAGNYIDAGKLFEESILIGCVFDSLLGLACCTYKSMDYTKSAYIVRLLIDKLPPLPETILLSGLLGITHFVRHDLLEHQAQSLLRTQEGNNLISAVLANLSEGCSLDLQCVRDALKCYQEAVACAPNNLIALHNAAVTLKCIGADEDSKRMFDAITSQNENSEVHRSALINLGELYFGQQRPLLACKYLYKATEGARESHDTDETWYTLSRIAESHVYACQVSDAKSVMTKFCAQPIGSSKTQVVQTAMLALDIMMLVENVQSAILETTPLRVSTKELQQTLDTMKRSPAWEKCSADLKKHLYSCESLIERLSHVGE